MYSADLMKPMINMGIHKNCFHSSGKCLTKDLRQQSVEFIAEKNMEGNAIGGLSVGEPTEVMYEITELVCGILSPVEKPAIPYGCWNSCQIFLESIALGIDMFDCVMPYPQCKNGMLFTPEWSS